MARIARVFGKALGVATLFAMLAACGSGSGSAANSGGGDVGAGPEDDSGDPVVPAIEGVATPSSVSVVTATNAN